MEMTPESVVQSQLEAYNAKDLGRLLAIYAEDAEMLEYPGTLVAKGREALGERFKQRFSEPDLHARLVKRIVFGDLIIDQELVTRNFPEGKGSLELLMFYEVSGGLIRRARIRVGRNTLG